MSTLKVISTTDAPKAIGPYSQAIDIGNLLFCSGQIPLNHETATLEPADIATQTQRVLRNVKAVVLAGGSHPSKILKTTVFLTDLKNFEVFNRVYEEFFKTEAAGHYPARSTIQVSALPRGSMVEIEAIALK